MTPIYCPFHEHWTDGHCAAGKRSINRHDVTLRISDIDALLGDDESSQSRGFTANKALEVERAMLTALQDALTWQTEPAYRVIGKGW